MTTVAPRLPARFKPVYASLLAVVLMGSSAHPAAAQRDAGSAWRAGVAGTVLIRAFDNDGTNEGLARAGLQGVAYLERWLTPEAGVRAEAGWLHVGNGHVYRESPPLPPGSAPPANSCALVCSHLELAGGELSLLNAATGTHATRWRTEVGAGVYRTLARPYDPAQGPLPMLTVGAAHISWSRGFDPTPVWIHVRAQTFAGGVMPFAVGAGLGVAF